MRKYILMLEIYMCYLVFCLLFAWCIDFQIFILIFWWHSPRVKICFAKILILSFGHGILLLWMNGMIHSLEYDLICISYQETRNVLGLFILIIDNEITDNFKHTELSRLKLSPCESLITFNQNVWICILQFCWLYLFGFFLFFKN